MSPQTPERHTNNLTRNTLFHSPNEITVMDVERNEVRENVKIGIIKSLHEKGILTAEQMKQALSKLQAKRREHVSC